MAQWKSKQLPGYGEEIGNGGIAAAATCKQRASHAPLKSNG